MSKESLREQQAEEKRAARLDYETTAFMLKKPCSNAIFKGPLLIRDKAAHRRLIEIARENGLYVWYASVQYLERGSRQVPCAIGIHLIDWDSVPDHPAAGGIPKEEAKGETLAQEQARLEVEAKYPEDLKCSVCGQQCSSTSGYTLHAKTHVDEVHSLEDQAPDLGEGALCCPTCGKRCTSLSGLTLHRQSKGH